MGFLSGEIRLDEAANDPRTPNALPHPGACLIRLTVELRAYDGFGSAQLQEFVQPDARR